MMATAFLAVLDKVPGFWGFALGALALILSPVPVVWVSSHRRSVQRARINKESLKDRDAHEERMLELANTQKARMYELETDRQHKLLVAQLERGLFVDQASSTKIEFPLRQVETAPIPERGKKVAAI